MFLWIENFWICKLVINCFNFLATEYLWFEKVCIDSGFRTDNELTSIVKLLKLLGSSRLSENEFKSIFYTFEQQNIFIYYLNLPMFSRKKRGITHNEDYFRQQMQFESSSHSNNPVLHLYKYDFKFFQDT